MTMLYAVDLYAMTPEGPTLIPVAGAEHRSQNEEIYQALHDGADALGNAHLVETAFARAGANDQGRGYPVPVTALAMSQVRSDELLSEIDVELLAMVTLIDELASAGAPPEQMTLFISYH